MSGLLRDAFTSGIKSLARPTTAYVAVVAAGLGYLVDREHADIAEPMFIASVTVLVFLLPAAGIVGPYLLAETKDALGIISQQHNDEDREKARNIISGSLQKILGAARLLQCGFIYAALAVILSAVAITQVGAYLDGIEVEEILSAIALALLLGTAATVFPMTWRLLQLREVQSLCDALLATEGEPVAVDPHDAPVITPAAHSSATRRQNGHRMHAVVFKLRRAPVGTVDELSDVIQTIEAEGWRLDRMDSLNPPNQDQPAILLVFRKRRKRWITRIDH